MIQTLSKTNYFSYTEGVHAFPALSGMRGYMVQREHNPTWHARHGLRDEMAETNSGLGGLKDTSGYPMLICFMSQLV